MSGPKPEFTLDELLEFLRGDEERKEGYFTAREWAGYFGVTAMKMLQLLHEARRKGVLRVDRAYRNRVDDIRQRFPVYSFDLEKEKAERDDAPPHHG